MKLVEVVRGYQTSDETVEELKALSKQLTKEPVEVKKIRRDSLSTGS